MLDRLTDQLLWDKQLTPGMKNTWTALILLAPLALAGAVALQTYIARQVPARVTAGRQDLLEKAYQLAAAHGMDARGWEESVDVSSNPEDSASTEIYRYLLPKGNAGRTLLVEEGLWSRIHVRLREPDGTQRVDMWFSPTGRQTGYQFKLTSQAEPSKKVEEKIDEKIPEAEGTRLAGERIQAMLLSHPWMAAEATSAATSDDNQARVLRWKVWAKEFPGAVGEAVVRIQGRQVTQETVNLHFDKKAAGEPKATSEKVPGNNRDKRRFAVIGYVLLLAGYTLIRYLKRRAQKEVSRHRMLLIAFLLGGFLMGEVYLQDSELVKFTTEEAMIPAYLILLLSGLASLVVGLGGGLAYSASEGDLREIDSRRLTSVDALLAGKLFSRNVGRSILLGTVVLGWMMLVWSAVYVLAGTQYPGMETLASSYGVVFSRMPWLSMTLAAVSYAIFMTLLTVFCPGALIWRQVRRPGTALALISLVAFLPLLLLGHEPFGAAIRAAFAAIQAAGLVASFLLVDLLATAVVCAGFYFLPQIIMLGQTAAGWREQEASALLLAVGIVAGAALCARYGRAVDQDAVRPAYAREIFERQQLESEVEAAKEAQQRLLPAAAPALPGLSVTASCQAADIVSGDFYDFFPIGQDKLGILISDGGGNGLATALMIAFAKGYLMEKALAGGSAVQTLRALEANLGEQLRGVSSEGLFYGVVDVSDGTFRYARIGATPAVLMVGADQGIHDSSHEIRHQGEGLSFWEGYIRLGSASRLVIYTNGLCRLIGEPEGSSTNRWLQRRIGGVLEQAPAALHEWIVKTIFQRKLGRGKRTVADDVTVMVIGLERANAAAVEHVA